MPINDNPDFRQASFVAGEWSPLMYARSDYKKFPMALRKCLNWMVAQQGPLINRPGSLFLAKAKDQANKVRLVPFNFSADQNLVMEFGGGYIRFFQNGARIESPPGTPVEVATTYAAADLAKLKFTQSGDVVTITHRDYAPMDLSRLNAAGTSWSIAPSALRELKRQPLLSWIDNWDVSWSTSASAKPWRYGITAVYSDGTESTVVQTEEVSFDRTAVASVIKWYFNPDGLQGLPIGYNVWLGRGGAWGFLDYVSATTQSSSAGADTAGGFYIDTTLAIDKAPTLADRPKRRGSVTRMAVMAVPPTAGQNAVNAPDFALSPPSGVAPFTGIPQAWAQDTNYYPGDRVTANGNTYECVEGGRSCSTGTGPNHTSGVLPDGGSTTWARGLQRKINSPYNNGDRYIFNGCTWVVTAGGGGNTANNAYPLAGGPGILTVVGPFADGSRFVTNVGMTDGALTVSRIDSRGVAQWKFVQVGTARSKYPAVGSYYQQRKVFANTYEDPTRIVYSRVGVFGSFEVMPSPLDDDAIDVSLSSDRYEEIRSFLSMRQLLTLTSEKDWTLIGQNSKFTPTTVFAQPNSVRGISWLDPIMNGVVGLYVQALGTQVWELNFDFYTQSYLGTDVTVEAEHLFRGRSIVSWAYAPVPFSVVWAVRDDGVLLGMTHVREQEVRAWHRHKTQGTYESVAAIPETVGGVPETGVYVAVNRAGGRMIERFATRTLPVAAIVDDYPVYDTSKGVFLDAAVVSTGYVITGLSHLEGQAVMALVDGGVAGPYTVTGGQIDITADFPDGPPTTVIVGLSYNCDAETLDLIPANVEIRSNMKNVYRTSFEVADTRGLSAGPDLAHLTEWQQRQITDGVNAIAPFTGLDHLRVVSKYEHGGRLVFRHSDPLPAALLAVSRETNVGGD